LALGKAPKNDRYLSTSESVVLATVLAVMSDLASVTIAIASVND
jgi:hypothetical protein